MTINPVLPIICSSESYMFLAVRLVIEKFIILPLSMTGETCMYNSGTKKSNYNYTMDKLANSMLK
jgi:hypothetical protein